MAHFDWFPYLEGKYLTYYQWFSLLGCTACMVLSFLSFFVYLLICRLSPKPPTTGIFSLPFIDRLKQYFFNAGFIFLALVPLVLTALDVIWLISGIIGMMLMFTLGVYLDNGRKKTEVRERQLLEQIVSS
jgi:hypothetical protein